MNGLKNYRIWLLLALAVFSACKRNRLKVNLSDVKTEVEIVHFSNRLFDTGTVSSTNSWEQLANDYPDFFDLFTYHIIRIGGKDENNFPERMQEFVGDSLILEVKAQCDSVFYDLPEIDQQIKKAFRYYAFHFPDKDLPVVFTYISGFNQSIVTAKNMVGISLDKYLGRACSYYQQLATAPHYKTLNMWKGRMIPEMAFAWAITEFEDPNSATNVLDNIVQKGKMMYLVDAMLPTTPDSLKIGYTSKQMNWCKMNETAMWTYLIENKMLYSNKRMDVVRYINDAPSTSGFPLESPGRTGVWIGWQIVRQYMQKHPEISLPELMENKDYQQILNESEYDPN